MFARDQSTDINERTARAGARSYAELDCQ